MAGSQVSQQATPSTPALAAAEVSTGAMAEKLGTGYSAADIVEPDVVNQPAAQPGATGPGIGDRYPSQRVRGVNSGDRPALRHWDAGARDRAPARGRRASTLPRGSDPGVRHGGGRHGLGTERYGMRSDIINAHEPASSTTAAPEAIDVLVLDAHAQVPPDQKRHPMSQQEAMTSGANRSGTSPPGDPATSARSTSANRKNSRGSTGPKTASGKARASRNAVQHGLSAAKVGDALVSAEAVRMAKTFGFEDMSRSQFEQFLTIAKCEVELNRIAAARIAIFERELARLAAGRQHQHVHPELQDVPAQLLRDEMSAFNRAIPALGMLDRYERRALSRRRRAIVNFVACSIIKTPSE